MFEISAVWMIGIILALVGAVLWLLSAVVRSIAGRRHYFWPAVSGGFARSDRSKAQS